MTVSSVGFRTVISEQELSAKEFARLTDELGVDIPLRGDVHSFDLLGVLSSEPPWPLKLRLVKVVMEGVLRQRENRNENSDSHGKTCVNLKKLIGFAMGCIGSLRLMLKRARVIISRHAPIVSTCSLMILGLIGSYSLCET